MKTIGIPGPGGSLGRCAICGNNFLAAVLLAEEIVQFRPQSGVDLVLSAHHACFEKTKDIKEWRELPRGPLREAYENYEQERQESK